MILFSLHTKPLALAGPGGSPRRERGDFAVRGLALIEEDVYSESDETRMARSRATAVKAIVLALILL